jgi:hypothetical protein
MIIPPMTSFKPCLEWAEHLAARPVDLVTPEREALERHVATCAACAAVRDDYRAIDALIQGLPQVQPLPGLPPRLVRLWDDEDRELAASEIGARDVGADGITPHVAPRSAALAASHHRLRHTLRALAAVLIVGALLGSYFLLVAGRMTGPTTGGRPSYGPPVDPAGPRPHLGAWRTITLPPGSPNRATQAAQPGAAGGLPTGGAVIYEQTSVSGLLYAVAPPAVDGGTKLWRSTDAGRTWVPLAVPAAVTALPAGAQIDLFLAPADPDTVFLWGYSAGPRGETRLYSQDRGADWTMLAMPAGLDAWNVTVPMAARGVWYLPVRVGVQPAIWVSTNHGQSWTPHPYPVTLPPRDLAQSAPAGVTLSVQYERGGLLWAYGHTLWWSPDYGVTWRRLGVWGNPLCNALIIGTPDLSVLYCLFSNGAQMIDANAPLSSRPIWRSTDRGQTWRPVPSGPDVVPGRGIAGKQDLSNPPWNGESAMLLRDGSLLILAPARENPNMAAFWTLTPGANVWHEASAPLASPQGYCLAATPGSGSGVEPPVLDECALPLLVTVTAGPGDTQLVYVTHAQNIAVTSPVYVASLTWR